MVTFIKKVLHYTNGNMTPYKDVKTQPAWLVPAIAGAVSLISTWLGNKSEKNQQIDLYNKQRSDNLTDSNSQNIYNSPQSQMERLRTAGLNPHLVYGNGNSVQAAASTKPADPGKPVQAPDYGNIIGTGLSQYQDIRMQEAQVDNLKAQKTVYDQDAILKASQTASNAMSTARSEFELKQGQSLAASSLQAAKLGVEKLSMEIDSGRQNMDIRSQTNLREAATNSSNLKEAIQRMLTMQQQRASQQIQNAKTQQETKNAQEELKRIQQNIINLDKDNQLKQLDIEMRRKGIMPSDNMGFRILGRLWEKYDGLNNKILQDNKKP